MPNIYYAHTDTYYMHICAYTKKKYIHIEKAMEREREGERERERCTYTHTYVYIYI